MADGKSSGDSRTGRRLFSGLRRIGAQVLDAGPSDWVVYPGVDGYSGDDDIFLHAIIDTVQGALQSSEGVSRGTLDEWSRVRHAQIEARELVYIAHQLDVLARVSLTLFAFSPRVICGTAYLDSLAGCNSLPPPPLILREPQHERPRRPLLILREPQHERPPPVSEIRKGSLWNG